MDKMTKTDKVLEAIFDWGHGFGGLLFMILVMAPALGIVIAGFIKGMVLWFEVFGLV